MTSKNPKITYARLTPVAYIKLKPILLTTFTVTSRI